MKIFSFALLSILFLCIILSEKVSANERRFGYTYESSVLPPGVRELEVWNTYRRGRSYFYRRLDQRIEYEFGISNNLMSAFYFNATSRSTDSNMEAVGGSKSSSYSVSISSEWKYKLLDRVADPFGFALYGEGTLGTDAFEFEGKLIFDKQVQQILFAIDIAGEYESSIDVINGHETISEEFKIKSDIGLSYLFSNAFGVGIEMRNENIYFTGSLKHSSLFAGTTISYSTGAMWATITFLPQIYSFKGGTAASNTIDLDEFEKIQMRLLLSFHI